MDSVFAQRDLEAAFDQALREVTEKAGGIRLSPGSGPPQGEVCTVTALFESGFHTTLALCAEEPFFLRLTRHMLGGQPASPRDVEDFSKEYFNMLCGLLAGLLFRPTRIASRFGLPAFYWGRFRPEGLREQFALTYLSDQREGVQLIHLVPGDPDGAAGARE